MATPGAFGMGFSIGFNTDESVLLPTILTLTADLDSYVEGKGNPWVAECVEQAVTFIGCKFKPALSKPPGTLVEAEEFLIQCIEAACAGMSIVLFKREVLELGADLFYRRQARNGIVSVNAMDGQIARVATDPWKASEIRLQRFLPMGFA